MPISVYNPDPNSLNITDWIIMRISIFSLLALMFAGLIGCTPVLFPIAPLKFDSEAKEFPAVSNKASVYIYRDQMFFGSAIPITTMVNGRNIGNTAAQTYFWLKLDPGEYVIEAYATNNTSLRLTVEAGKKYFLRQQIEVGAEAVLNQVNENIGRTGVLECKLIIPTGSSL